MKLWLYSALLFGTFLMNPGQDVPPPNRRAVDVYAKAKPYIDLPMAQLYRQVNELVGFHEDTDQSNLPDLLAKTSAVVVDQLPRVPNLTAHEEVTELAEKTRNITYGESALMPTSSRNYEYMVRRVEGPNGIPLFDEKRVDARNPNRHLVTSPFGSGFGGVWLMLSTTQLQEQRYRYLGRQKLHGRDTHVIAFAQIPEKVAVPGVIGVRNRNVPLLVQGVIWVDALTFQVIRIRMDLLGTLPLEGIEQLKSVLDFSEAILPGYRERLWLPKQVGIEWKILGQHAGERHEYSKYRLYTASVRIIP